MIFIDALKYSYETLFRTFPVPVNTGLKIFGTPDNTSPIFVTGNFSLTVRMMLKMLHKNKINAYLLVANTSGVNVWCAAGGGHFSAMEIIAVIKTTNIGDVTSQRKLILPQLGASGVNVKEIRRKTGFKSVFGPVHLEDIPQFLKLGHKEKMTSQMKKIRFTLQEKLEMGVGITAINQIFFIDGRGTVTTIGAEMAEESVSVVGGTGDFVGAAGSLRVSGVDFPYGDGNLHVEMDLSRLHKEYSSEKNIRRGM